MIGTTSSGTLIVLFGTYAVYVRERGDATVVERGAGHSSASSDQARSQHLLDVRECPLVSTAPRSE